MEQILKKTSPLEYALKPNTFASTSQQSANISAAPSNSSGPSKKILVFPNKKRFPLAQGILTSNNSTA